MKVIYLQDRKESIAAMVDALFKGLDKIPHLTCKEACTITTIHQAMEKNKFTYDADTLSTIRELYGQYKEHFKKSPVVIKGRV
jgi:hypothetical protein